MPTIAMLDRIATAMRTTFMGDEAVSMAEARYAEHRALQDKGAGG